MTDNVDSNFRLNPTTGLIVAQDAPLDLPNDVESVVGLGYTGNYANSGGTTLLGYNFSTDFLVRIGGPGGDPSPNTGTVFNIGSSGVTANSFDIGLDVLLTFAEQTVFASLRTTISNTGACRLYTLDGDTGAASLLRTTCDGATVITDIAVAVP